MTCAGLASCANQSIAPNSPADSKQNAELHELFKSYSSFEEDQYPRPDHPNADKRKGSFGDLSPKSFGKTLEKLKTFQQRLSAISFDSLSEQDKVNYEMFQFTLRSEIAAIENQTYLFPLIGDTGFYFSLLRMGDTADVSSPEKVQFYVEKLADIERYLGQWKSNLQLAVEQKRLLPKIVLKDFEKPLLSLMNDSAEKSGFFKPLTQIEKVLDEGEAEETKKKALAIIKTSVFPAINEFVAYLKQDYLPLAREGIAIYDMEGGKAYYRSQIDYYTTLSLSPDEIHNIGLAEVKRIKAEMDEVIKASGFKGSFAEFVEFLRTDPQFYAKTPEKLLKQAAFISKKADGVLPQFFGRLPRQPYGVEPVPEAIAPRYTTGRYVGAPLDSTRGGTYWVNTYALNKRPLYVLEALTLHEAVPGHHLQSALTKELDSLPDFRRNSYLSAYGEGWALYCEKLGIEAGFYQDAYSQFGRLSYEMWRAIRLVVDTGMHAKGWSRDQAIEFMENNTALSKHNVRTEIDRYIAWPGQALSYKLGEIKIVELRKKAEQALGKQFDIRAFHDEILSYGPVTLEILDRLINQWIETQKLDQSMN
ncbi:MAG: DUF885 domain-containing protein [Gammaproteobacteria bacterium]|nr:DUF885 domain-containing protein [Gammaproteobacteria bacterium]